MMNDNIRILQEGNFSCVISNGDEQRTFTQRGVADLYDLYRSEPQFLKGASVADKVVGKAAASLMILGGVKQLYTNIASEPALDLLAGTDIEVEYTLKVPFIENSDRTGWCPLESACYELKSEAEALIAIQNFIAGMRK
jgi:iron complex outermembrane receptor protein/vitamin B12 transporter